MLQLIKMREKDREQEVYDLSFYTLPCSVLQVYMPD